MPTPKPSKELARIRRSLEQMKPRQEDAARFFRAYCGDYSQKTRKELDSMTDEVFLNFVFQNVENLMPKILSGEPRGSVEGKNEASEASAASMEATGNYWFKELGAKKHFEKALFDWFFGYACVKVGWEYEEEIEQVEAPVLDPATGMETGQTELVEQPKVIKNKPKIRWVSPWNLLRDPDAESPEFDTVRTERMLVKVSQLEAMGDLDEKALEMIKPSQIPVSMAKLPFKNEQKTDSEKEWVVLYETWDIENNEVRLIAENCEQYLSVKPWPYEFEVGEDRWPITIIEGKQSTESNYSMSEYRAYWSQIVERNRVRTSLQSNARRMRPAWMNKKGSGNTEKELNDFANRKSNEIVSLTNPDGLKQVEHPAIPLDFYKYDEIARDDLQNTSASLDSRNDSVANTATEASLQAASGNVRSIRKQQQFEEFVAIVFAKLCGLCQQFMDEAVAVKIKKPTQPNELSWMHISQEDIQGEFNYTVKPGVMQHRNEALHRQQVLKYGELMANNPYVRQDKLAKLLTEANELDPDELLKTPKEFAEEQSNKPPQDPNIKFKDIDPALAPPQVQLALLQAAFAQNGVKPPQLPQPGQPGQGAPMDGMPPNGGGLTPPEGGLPGMELNAAPPPMEGAEPPPMNPIQPASEFEGGSQF